MRDKAAKEERNSKLPGFDWAARQLAKLARKIGRQEKAAKACAPPDPEAAPAKLPTPEVKLRMMFDAAAVKRAPDAQRAKRELKATASLSKRRKLRDRHARAVSCFKPSTSGRK